jgi:hypothetical protein
MNLVIIGDSFSSDATPGSWVELIAKSHQLQNYSLRGISQYRIFNSITKNLIEINKADAIIIWHTNPDRVYINDEIKFPTRESLLHPYADLVASDSLSSQSKEWQDISKTYYKIFYNQTQQIEYYQLMLEKIKSMLDKKKVIHCSGFNLPNIFEVKSFKYLLSTNSGTINHYDLAGNQVVANYINSKL